MRPDDFALTYEERTLLLLRSLYQQYGYSQYRMSKFEEYDLYAGNKDFLVSENVLTFTDLNGKLMALKPDVTLSIVRGSPVGADSVRKVFYNENVYRTAGSSRSFREIPQTGLECIGPIDDYCVLEVLLLAAESLKRMSGRCVLEISHLDVVAALTEKLCLPEETKKRLMKCIGGKNLSSGAASRRTPGRKACSAAPWGTGCASGWPPKGTGRSSATRACRPCWTRATWTTWPWLRSTGGRGVLSPLVIVMYLDSVVDGMLKGLGLHLSSMFINVADAAMTLLCVCLLLPRFGVRAYIAILYLSECCNFALSFLCLRRLTAIKLL